MQQHLLLLDFYYKMSYHQNMRTIKHIKKNSSTDLPLALEKFSVIQNHMKRLCTIRRNLFRKDFCQTSQQQGFTNKLLFQGCVHSLSRKKHQMQ